MAATWLLAAVAGMAGPARAEPEKGASTAPSATPASVVVPPEAVATPVVYPQTAPGPGGEPTEVVLEITVGPDGHVVEARLVAGEEPFASAALDAASGWQFRPATRDGKPLSAKVRFAVRFVPPVAPAPNETSAPNATRPAATASSRDQPSVTNEVIVRGHRVAPGGVSLSRTEVRNVPGAFGDPFRAIDALGGVTPVASGVPYFFVRGAPPGNIGYFIDGIRIPLLFHIFLGPSVIHPLLIDQVDLYRGASPARFGRFGGAIVAADLTEPTDRFRAEATVRAFDAGAVVQTPFADGRGHLTLAGRYSYTAAAVSLFSDASLGYWDYQGLVTYDLTPKDRIGVFGFGAYDRFQVPGQDLGAPSFHRIDLRYDHRMEGGSSFRTAVAFGQDLTGNFLGESRDRSIAPRISFRTPLGPAATLEAGADATIDNYTFTVLLPTPGEESLAQLFPSRVDTAIGTYAEITLRPASWYSVTPALRVDRFSSAGENAIAIEPRISAMFAVSPSLRVIHSFGLAHQTPNFVPGVPAVSIAGLAGGLQKSLQASSGVEADLPDEMTASFTLFDNVFWNLVDPLGIAGDVFAHPETASIRAIGSSIGAEVLVRRPLTRKIGGFLSYTLSRTTRSHDRIQTLASIDRTHVLNAAVGYDLGRNWRIGARGSFTSGVPAQHVTFDGHIYDGYGRAPPFVRLDLRLEKRWIINDHAYWAFTAELFNATFSAEVISRTCNAADGCVNQRLGPVTIPSVGVEAAF